MNRELQRPHLGLLYLWVYSLPWAELPTEDYYLAVQQTLLNTRVHNTQVYKWNLFCEKHLSLLLDLMHYPVLRILTLPHDSNTFSIRFTVVTE